MPRKYNIETIDSAIKSLWNSKPAKIKKKTKLSKGETIEKIAPTIKRMRERGFSYEEIAAKFTEKEINIKVKDVAQLFDTEKQANTNDNNL